MQCTIAPAALPKKPDAMESCDADAAEIDVTDDTQHKSSQQDESDAPLSSAAMEQILEALVSRGAALPSTNTDDVGDGVIKANKKRSNKKTKRPTTSIKAPRTAAPPPAPAKNSKGKTPAKKRKRDTSSSDSDINPRKKQCAPKGPRYDFTLDISEYFEKCTLPQAFIDDAEKYFPNIDIKSFSVGKLVENQSDDTVSKAKMNREQKKTMLDVAKWDAALVNAFLEFLPKCEWSWDSPDCPYTLQQRRSLVLRMWRYVSPSCCFPPRFIALFIDPNSEVAHWEHARVFFSRFEVDSVPVSKKDALVLLHKYYAQYIFNSKKNKNIFPVVINTPIAPRGNQLASQKKKQLFSKLAFSQHQAQTVKLATQRINNIVEKCSAHPRKALRKIYDAYILPEISSVSSSSSSSSSEKF